MATELFIPKLGQTVEEVTIVSWLVEDGAKVEFGDQILEVETDKAVFPIEANGKGYVHIGPYQQGLTVPVLTVVATIGKKDDVFKAGEVSSDSELEAAESAVTAETPVSEAKATVTDGEKVFSSPRARKTAEGKGIDLSQVTATGYGGVRVVERDVVNYLAQQPKITPVAQRIAEEAGINLREVTGTGPQGKIVREDVERLVAKPQPVSAPIPTAPVKLLPEAEVVESIPLKGVRALIAERMQISTQTTSRVTLLMEVDATAFVEMRTHLKEKVSADWGFAPGYNDLIAKVVAISLRKFPFMNARLTPTAIERLAHVNVAMAVDTDRGLLVPVIRDADQKSIREFGKEFREMVELARIGRLNPDHLTGGTFTITNLGMYDVDAFTPVINLPEAAILGLGKITPKPVVYQGQVAIRQMWTLSLVFDHRLIDGAPAAKFLQSIKNLVEDPYLMIAE